MRVALCQTTSGTDKRKNLDDIARYTRAAADDGAQLAVFPEMAMFLPSAPGPELLTQAEELDGAFVTAVEKVAAETGTHIIAGMNERSAGHREVFNSAVFVAPDHGLSAVYRKQHLYDAFGVRESEYVRPGELTEPVVFDVGGARVGLLTCYDLRFPEPARLHADAGVDILVYPAAWAPGENKVDHWHTLVRARAIENTIFVAAVSTSPSLGTGNSLAVDPAGVVLAKLGNDPGIAVAEIARDRIDAVRRTNPSLANRRYSVVPS